MTAHHARNVFSADLSHLLTRQLGRWIVFAPEPVPKASARMPNVFLERNVFKIIPMVVGLDSILVVHLLILRAWANESRCDNRMDRKEPLIARGARNRHAGVSLQETL